MDNDFNTRLKKYILNIIRHEHNRDAWEHFKTLQPNCDDLSEIIGMNYTPFAKEAWALFQLQDGTADDYLHLVTYPEDKAIRNEAATIVLQKFTLDAEDLESIVEHTGNDIAASQLLAKNPTKDQLLSIVKYSSISDQAAQRLLPMELELYELKMIIQYSNLKNEAWQQLIQQAPKPQEIIEIIQDTDFDDTAWEYLTAQNPSNDVIEVLILDYPDSDKKRYEAALYILNNQPKVSDLCTLIRKEICADEAWAELISRPLDDKDMSDVVWNLIRREKQASERKEKAAELCLQYVLTADRLWDIFNYTNHKAAAAQQLIQSSLTLYELTDLVLNAPIQPVLEELGSRVNFDYNPIRETQLIQKITKIILENPDKLDVNHWHNEDKHSLGGWAIQLDMDAQRVEKAYSSEIAASLLLPNYVHLFFAEKDLVLKTLKEALL